MKVLLPILLLLLPFTPLRGAAPTFPTSLKNVEGNSYSDLPFESQGAPSRRYQQVYSSTEFVGVPFEGQFVQAIAFRRDTDVNTERVDILLPDVQINLSTTSRNPDGLSSNFAANVGSDDRVVFGRKELRAVALISPDRPDGFVIQVFFDRPFFYRPSAGNLLLDIRIFTFTNSLELATIDASNVQGDSISTVSSDNVSNPSGNVSTRGLVTVIFTTPPPSLQISRTNSNLSLRWHFWPGPFVLETSSNLFLPNSWTRVAQTVTSNNFYLSVSQPITANITNRFYRLRYQP